MCSTLYKSPVSKNQGGKASKGDKTPFPTKLFKLIQTNVPVLDNTVNMTGLKSS